MKSYVLQVLIFVFRSCTNYTSVLMVVCEVLLLGVQKFCFQGKVYAGRANSVNLIIQE